MPEVGDGLKEFKNSLSPKALYHQNCFCSQEALHHLTFSFKLLLASFYIYVYLTCCGGAIFSYCLRSCRTDYGLFDNTHFFSWCLVLFAVFHFISEWWMTCELMKNDKINNDLKYEFFFSFSFLYCLSGFIIFCRIIFCSS